MVERKLQPAGISLPASVDLAGAKLQVGAQRFGVVRIIGHAKLRARSPEEERQPRLDYELVRGKHGQCPIGSSSR